jgi:hypothetical protein
MNPNWRIQRDQEIDIFRKALANARKGTGSIICISGENGYGKSFLLDIYTEECAKKDSGVVGVNVEGQPPIGNFNIGNIQPLLPFQRALEMLLSNNTITAQRKFAVSTAMTVLASLPLAGDIFYAVKEISKDYRQYKKDQTDDKRLKGSNIVQEFIDSLLSFTEKQPVVLLMDDMHWSDAQSVELVNLLADRLDNMPIVLVMAYRNSIVEDTASPLLSFVKHYHKKNDNIYKLDLQGFNSMQMSEFCRHYIPNYVPNRSFEDWLYSRSNGVPGVLADYVRYFLQNSPFREDGSLVENFSFDEYLPATMHAAFSQILEKLTEDERNILALCSAEGREFTALLAGQLLNTDILTAIKRLRHLQGKTSIIRSIGAHIRYGVKTTIYEFTQAFYQTYFENTLEFEEKIALHGQIAAYLKTKYDEADTEALKSQIAPYLAAHSSEAGDNDTAKAMLLQTAQNAERMGNPEIVKSIYDKFLTLTDGKDLDESENPDAMAFKNILAHTNTEETGYSEDLPITGNENVPGGTSYLDFITVRKVAVGYYHQNKFSEAADYILRYINKHEQELRSGERAQLLAIAVKSFIEQGDLTTAESYCQKAIQLINSNNDPVAECFVMNVSAMLRFYQNRQSEAADYLQRAVKKAIGLPNELQLLTVSNIALIAEQPEQMKKKYLNAARNLSSKLRFEDFASDLYNLMKN